MFYTFDLITEALKPQVGGKGFNLSILYQAKFSVPEGGVLSVEAFDASIKGDPKLFKKIIELQNTTSPNENAMELARQINTEILTHELNSDLIDTLVLYMESLFSSGYPSIAVRSSCVLEDMEQNSFAGQYDSVIGVGNRQQLSKALLKCWASTFSPRVIQYCIARKISLSQLKPAVVFQGVIEAETAGVIFTVDPMTGDDKTMVIDAAEGLAEALVQGELTPNNYRYDWFSKEHKEFDTDGCLRIEEVEQLCGVALDIQKFYGVPQDIEWAYMNNNLYILQARPIAAIHIASDCQWSNADFKDGGVASTIPTRLMWSLYESVFEYTMPHFLKSVGLYPKVKHQTFKWTHSFFGYPYWNLSAVKAGVKKIPGFNEREFDSDLGIQGHYDGDGEVTGYNMVSIVSGLVILYKINKSIKNRLASSAQILQDIGKQITTLEKVDLNLLNDKGLHAWTSELVGKHHFYIEGEYFKTIYDNSNAATLFKDALKKYNKKNCGRSDGQLSELHLISGLGNISHLRHVDDLWSLSRELLLSPERVRAFLDIDVIDLCEMYKKNQDFPFISELSDYIEKYKHHSLRELDLLVPCWDEDPSSIFSNLKYFLSEGDDRNPCETQINQVASHRGETGKIQSVALMKALEIHRRILSFREEMRNQSTRMYRLIRLAYLALGERLYAAGIVDSANKIFFLSARDALNYFECPTDHKLKALLNSNWDHYQSFRNFKKPNEIFPSINANRYKSIDVPRSGDDSESLCVLNGVGCSPGEIEGIVWVQVGDDIPSHLDSDVILVAPFTDPSYTLLFASIGGLITETGGMLSHGAVVSREYGIPAVLAVAHACTKLRTGMRVHINGCTGVVTIKDD